MDPFPAELLTGAHPPAAWRQAGVSRREMEGPAWTRTARGLYAWNPAGDPGALERIRWVAAALPAGAAIGGWAASLLWGSTHADGEDLAGRLLPVPVCLGRDQTCRRLRGHRLWRSDLREDDVAEVDGIPVTSPVRTAFDLARMPALVDGSGHGGVTEAVVLVDGLLTASELTIGEVVEYADRYRMRRGVDQARRVLSLAVPGSLSPGESRFRLLWELDAGLPRPLVNVRVVDRDGVLLGCVDLLDPEAGMVGEYDGAYHAEVGQRSHDNVRGEGLVATGLVVVRAASPDLTAFRRRTVVRLQAARRRGLSRNRARDTWRIAG